jgi:Spy/CpxP family protein refolding chaperone
MKTKVFYSFAIVFLITGMARAQQPAEGRPQPQPAPEARPMPQPQANPDPFARNFYPPDLIMQNQEALQLTGEQQSYFKTEMRKAQMNFTELQWKLQDEAEKLMSIAKAQHVDEQQLLAQLEKVLNAERDVKRAQITLLVHIKNKLTPVQQAILDNLRRTRSATPEPRPEGE